MITSMRGCVVCNDLWTWPLSSRSFSHEFVIKLIKYGTSCFVRLQHIQFWMNAFHILHKWSLVWSGVTHHDLWSWPISPSCLAAHCLFYGSYSHVVQIQPIRGQCVMYHFQVKGQCHTFHLNLYGRGGGIQVDHWCTVSSYSRNAIATDLSKRSGFRDESKYLVEIFASCILFWYYAQLCRVVLHNYYWILCVKVPR